MVPSIHVVIASVPWRLENLVLLLEDVKAQTITPASITVLLDGYETPPELVGVDHVVVDPPGTGIWFRWRQASTKEGLVAFIDDDFRIESDYLESLFTCRENSGGQSVVSWHAPDFASYAQSVEKNTQVAIIGAGMCLFDPNQVRGMCDDPEIQGLQCADEPFLAYWLQKQGVEMWRPAGTAPVTSDPRFSRTSKSKRNLGVITRRLVYDICLRRGWQYKGRLPKMDTLILYYSHGSLPAELQRYCFESVLKNKPANAQLRCVVPERLSDLCKRSTVLEKECDTPGHADMFERILLGLKDVPDSTIVALAEHDVIYGPDHFKNLNAPFDGDFAWPSTQGLRFDIPRSRYSTAPNLMSSLRGKAGAIRRLISTYLAAEELPKTLEPDGAVIPEWHADFIDLRGCGNLTGRRVGAPLTSMPRIPAERLAQILSALKRGVEAPPPAPPQPPKPVPISPLVRLLEQRRNRYKRHV